MSEKNYFLEVTGLLFWILFIPLFFVLIIQWRIFTIPLATTIIVTGMLLFILKYQPQKN